MQKRQRSREAQRVDERILGQDNVCGGSMLQRVELLVSVVLKMTLLSLLH